MTPWTVALQAPLSMGILQARIPEWVAMPSSRGSSQPRDWTQFSHIASVLMKQKKMSLIGWLLNVGSAGKESVCSVGDLGLIPGVGRSPGEGKGYPLLYSGLENSMDCVVHGVAKSQPWLSNFHFNKLVRSKNIYVKCYAIEKSYRTSWQRVGKFYKSHACTH